LQKDHFISGLERLTFPSADREFLSGITVTRRDKAVWQRARKTDWGDAWQ
jgi:ribosomal protein RSM22 (predicted rRNA methylase)